MTTISWKATAEDFDLIAKIADRAVSAAKFIGVAYSKQTALMDITAAHCNGCPLDLAGLLAADDSNFSHDVFGIRRHLNRDTGELMDCFSPRYSAKAAGTPCDDCGASNGFRWTGNDGKGRCGGCARKYERS